MDDERVNKILFLEQLLYQKTKSIVEKYDILEKMKELLSDYFRNAPKVYEECKNRLRSNTWDALEEAWKLVFPSSYGEWVGPNALTFVLKKSNPYYEDCAFKGFVSCDYDVHGSPNFDKVTENNSIVDISDLYETLSVEQIGKRGGSKNSLQEIAQDRMAIKLEGVLKKWWAKNRIGPYDRYLAFYAWRDANDLVPHEDTNCRTMRLVFRPAHKAFKHRGGVSNSINIKTHFE